MGGWTVTCAVSVSHRAASQTRSEKASVVCADTRGAVKLAVAVSAPLSVTPGPEVWVHA